nr:hypothetical protein [Tanacetum cinerariifolium]
MKFGEYKGSSIDSLTGLGKEEGPEDIGSPGVDGLPLMPEDPYAYLKAALQAPLSHDYVSGLEHPPSPDYMHGPEHPPSYAYIPEFVPEPLYPEFMPPEDDSDPEEGLEEDDDDLEKDPVDYPTDREDDDEEAEEPSKDDANNEKEDEDKDEEEEPSKDLTMHRMIDC